MRTCPRPLTRLNLKKFKRKEWVFVAKEVVKKVKLQIPAGKANPAPPVGTVLGPAGINIQEFCQKFNDATKMCIRDRYYLLYYSDNSILSGE